MTLENPTAADIATLTKGATYRVNGRKYVFENICTVGTLRGMASITGMRGGWANIVPSTCKRAVQITTASGTRQWVRTLASV